MIRCLYRALISLHPPAFQEQFGDEMLWIFDETCTDGSVALLSDGFLSLLRQWFVGEVKYGRSCQWLSIGCSS